jgi:hypothetical protein
LPQMTDEIVSHSSPTGEGRSSFGPRAGSTSLPAVALVGFMGAGKTTVGRALAERLGWRFADLDDLIQAREGRSVEQIFREQGEAGFRKLERLTVREVAAADRPAPLVLALGGGAFPEEAVQEALREAGISACFWTLRSRSFTAVQSSRMWFVPCGGTASSLVNSANGASRLTSRRACASKPGIRKSPRLWKKSSWD